MCCESNFPIDTPDFAPREEKDLFVPMMIILLTNQFTPFFDIPQSFLQISSREFACSAKS